MPTKSASGGEAERDEDDAWRRGRPGSASRVVAPGPPTRCGSPARRRWSSGHSGGRVARKPGGSLGGHGDAGCSAPNLTVRPGRALRPPNPRPYTRPMPTPDARTAVLDDLEWRRMIADHTDLDALRASMAGGPLVVLRRLRPDRTEPPFRQPRAPRDDASPPAGGPSAHRPRRRCDRPRRRPERPIRGATASRTRRHRGMGRADPLPGRALPVVRRRRTPRRS